VERYERSSERQDFRNGSRERVLNTRLGSLTLNVPRHRNQPFKTMVFDNYTRSEQALISTMAEMVVNGVSTRKVSRVMETLCDTTFSKSTVSEVCKELDNSVSEFKDRSLDDIYSFVMVDATYIKVREEHRIVSKALMIALATNSAGKREIIGFDLYDCESSATWFEFFSSLKRRGLCHVEMITSDSHEGIRNAIARVFPDTPWQRCQTHFSRNVTDAAPKKYAVAINTELLEMYHSKTIEDARKIRDSIIEEYRDVAEKAMEILDDGFESVMTVMALPEAVRRYFRTTNHLERLNREVKRRSKVIGVFPNADSVVRLLGSVLMEQNATKLATSRTWMSKEDRTKLPLCKDALIKIAREQHKLFVA